MHYDSCFVAVGVLMLGSASGFLTGLVCIDILAIFVNHNVLWENIKLAWRCE